MAKDDGTVICPDCGREVRARPNKYEPVVGVAVKHKDASGANCDGWTVDGVDWKRLPGTLPAGWRSGSTG